MEKEEVTDAVKPPRWDWLDILKGFAIMAVIMDHFICVFPKTILKCCWNYTFFSVSMFVFLAGITSAMSYEKHGDASWTGVCKRLPHILLPYVLATFYYQLFFTRLHFDFIVFFKQLIFFDAFPQFYFVFFFLQLMLIAPVCFRLLLGKHPITVIWIPPVLLLTAGFSLWATLYTRMLPLHGAGKNILGGFFLVDFVLGMVFYRFRNTIMNWKVSGGAFLFFALAYAVLRRKLDFDGAGIFNMIFISVNPSGIYFTTYMFAVFFAFILFWSGLDFLRNDPKWKTAGDFIFRLFYPLSVFGKKSYVIFLFHMIPLMLIQKKAELLPDNFWGQILAIVAGVLFPPVFSILLDWIGGKIRKILFPPAL